MTSPGGGDAERITWYGDFIDGISRPARLAADSVDELGDESTETAAELKLLQNQADSTGDRLALLAAKAKLANDEFDSEHDYLVALRREFLELTKAQDRHTRSTEKLIKKKLTLKKLLNESKKIIGGFIGFLGKLAKIALFAAKAIGILSIAIGVVGLVAAVAKAIPWVAQLIYELSHLLALAALLPTAIGSLAASVITLKLAFKGVGDALSSGFTDDFEAYTQALNKLSPAAARFVKNVVGYAPQLKSLQRSVQEAFFAPLADQISPLLKTIIPVLGDGMTKLAASIARIFGVIMTWANSPAGISAISSFFRTAQMFSDTFAANLLPVLESFSRLLETNEPLWARLMSAMGRGMVKFANWVVKITDNGDLERWMDMAFEMVKLIVALLAPIWQIVTALAGASQGGALLTLVLFLQTIADYLNSAQGQEMLLGFFSQMGEIITALAPSLPILGNIFLLLAQIITDIVVGAAPGFLAFLQGLFEALQSVSKGDPDFWFKLGESIGGVLKDAVVVLPFFVDLLHEVVKLLSDKETLEAIIIISAALFAIFNFVTWLLPIISALVALGLTAGEAFAVVVAVIAVVIGLVMLVIGLVQNWGEITDWLGSKWDAFWIGVMAGWGWFYDTVLAPFGQLLWNLFVQPWINAVNWIVGLIEAVRGGWDTFWAYIGAGIDTATEILIAPFRALGEFVIGLWENIKEGWNGVKGFVSGGLNPWGDIPYVPFLATGGPVTAGMDAIVNEVGPEKFLSATGSLSDIGDGSMGRWTAPGDGFVIPAGLSAAIDRAIAAGKVGYDGPLDEAAAMLGHTGAGDTYDQRQYHMHATVTNPASELDVESALRKAWRKMKREEVERA